MTPQALKAGVTNALLALMASIQDEFKSSPEWQEIEKKAYPPPPVKEKKKQPKDKGSKYPGAAAASKGVDAMPDGSVQGEQREIVSLGTDADAAMKKLEIAGQEAGAS